MTICLLITSVVLVLIVALLSWLFVSRFAVFSQKADALLSRLLSIEWSDEKKGWEQERVVLDKRFERQKVGQRSKISGTILEKYCPFSPEYTYDPRDVVSVFDAFDFLVLRGKSVGQIEEIIIQEMKSNTKTPLNWSQKQLRDCVERGAIRFESWKLDIKTGKWRCI